MSFKKIIITGANGMLGIAISNALVNHQLFRFTSKELDITCTHQFHKKVAQIKPDYIINCAAYTAVDLAETEQEKAFKINAIAVEKIAQIAKQYNATLIHFSTDYVFQGDANQPYTVDHDTDPINVYGASKLAGEKAITQIAGNHYIFRISWLYAPYGKNFFKWVATTDQSQLNVVNTQIGSPTSAIDVASFMKHVILNEPKQYGLYHFTNYGAISWYDFAVMINKKLELGKEINPIDIFKTAAKRPAYSVMDCSVTQNIFDYKIPSVEKGFDKVVALHQ